MVKFWVLERVNEVEWGSVWERENKRKRQSLKERSILFSAQELFVEPSSIIMFSSVTAHASLLWLTLFFCPLTETFKPLLSPGGGSLTHRDITQRAIFRKTGQVCRAMAAAQDQDFTLPVRDQWDHVTHLLETDSEGCSGSSVQIQIYTAINVIYTDLKKENTRL